MSLPTDSKARKEIPMYSGLIAYFPDALAAVAEHSYRSNEKHNPGEPLHWSREKSADHMDTIIRHMTDIATGADKVEELKAVAWRSLAELQLAIEAKRNGNTINFYEEYAKGALNLRTPYVGRQCSCKKVFMTETDYIEHFGKGGYDPTVIPSFASRPIVPGP